MRISKLTGVAGIFGMVFTVGCLDPYMPPEVAGGSEFLVVDALLNTTAGTAEVTLKRTIPLDHEDSTTYEQLAAVFVLDEDGSSFALTEIEPGRYTATSIPVDLNKKYKVSIQTSNGLKYESALVAALQTPEIDSVTWRTEGEESFFILVHTHDDTVQPGYYRWRFEETWTYHSAYNSIIYYENGEIIYRNYDELIYECWGSDYSKDILVGSTAQLSANRIADYVVTAKPLGDEKIQQRYSILVKQYAITKEVFDYWQLLKLNTENLGTLFDPLPSQVTGNFTCVNRPDEPVLGHFSATSVATKRIFVNRRDLPLVRLTTQYDGCESDVIPIGQIPFGFGGLLVMPISVNSIVVGYQRSSTFCVDCRVAGGTTIKPDFWE